MSEIPRDIMEAAEQAAADLDGIHFNSRSTSWLDDARDIVARAILSEREACAKIAGEYDSLAVEAVLATRTLECPVYWERMMSAALKP